MIFLDSSVLVRYLTEDDPALATTAATLVGGEEEVGISTLVLLELVHVLRGKPYFQANPGIADALVVLLQHENLRLVDLDADLASAAIVGVRHLSARHIADALISASASHAGARLLTTNDLKFSSQLVPVEQLSNLLREE